jgi:hypothetical protein
MAHSVEVVVEDAPYEALESIALRRGRSVAEVVRDLLMQQLGSVASAPRRRLADMEGIFDDPSGAADHDVVLYGGSKRG